MVDNKRKPTRSMALDCYNEGDIEMGGDGGNATDEDDALPKNVIMRGAECTKDST